MSTLTQFAGSGVKQIITGYVNSVLPTNTSPGSGEDYFYYDITHGGTVNTSKCVVRFDGISSYPGYGNYSNNINTSAVAATRPATARLTSPTNLRLGSAVDNNIGNFPSYYSFTGRFTIVEYY